MRVRVPLALLGLTLALVTTGSVSAATTSAKAGARALGVRVVSPAGNATGGSVTAPPDASAGGSFSYGGGIVSAGSLATSAHAAAGTKADASASSVVGSVSLLGGEVTVASVRVKAHATASPASASGSLAGSSVSGLIVLGKAVDASPNSRLPLGDWGYAVVLEQAVVPAGSGTTGRRVFASGVHIHLTAAHAGLPAGTDITVGYAEATATAPKPPPPPPSGSGSGSGGSGGDGSGNGSGSSNGSGPSGGSGQSSGSNQHPEGGTDGGTTQAAPQHHVQAPSYDAVPQPPGANPTPPPIVQNPPTGVKPQLTHGGYVFPVYGSGASFSDDFAAGRADTGWHHGNDIFAPIGTPLLAVADGELFLVGVNALGGNRLWLRDGAGNEFYYAHLSAYSPLAFNGSRVKAGDVIGFVGATGDAVGTPPHLHFEVHPRGLLWMGYDGVVDPFPYLSAWRHLDDLAFGTVPAGQAPQPGAILLQAQDISGASGLDPGALAQALASPSLFGEGLATGAGAQSSSPGFAEGGAQGGL